MGWALLPHAEVQPAEYHYQTAPAALVKGDTVKAKRELKRALSDPGTEVLDFDILGKTPKNKANL
jgi:hypothetical protein